MKLLTILAGKKGTRKYVKVCTDKLELKKVHCNGTFANKLSITKPN